MNQRLILRYINLNVINRNLYRSHFELIEVISVRFQDYTQGYTIISLKLLHSCADLKLCPISQFDLGPESLNLSLFYS